MSLSFAPELFTAKVATGTDADPIMLEANLCRLADGSLFLSWTGDGTAEPQECNRSYFSKSYDHGRTWETPTVLFAHPRKGIFTPESFSVGNRILTFPCSYYEGSNFAQDCHSYISVSEDGGRTFTPPASIGNAINNVHAKDHLVLDDRIWVACSWVECTSRDWASFKNGNKDCIVAGVRFAPEDFKGIHRTEYCGVMISEDAGKTWSLHGRIGEENTVFVEPALTRLSDGTLVMLIRNNAVPFLFESRSTDGGLHWSEARNTGIPSSITKIALERDTRGRIYLLHNPKGKRNPLSLWISDDDMQSWSKKVDLISGDAEERIAYPDIVIDEERGILCFGWDDRSAIYYSEYPLDAL